MIYRLKHCLILVCGLCLLLASTAGAKVSAEEAAQLGKTLTPFGGEIAGNADGTIPAWNGGLTAPPAGVTIKPGDKYPNPFAGEKPLFTITAANMDQYKDKLTPGQMALLKKFPDTYKLNIYPTHRTAAAPQWVYDNTKANATRAETIDGGNSVINAFGGLPFPIPKTGSEAIYNHLARWQGTGRNSKFTSFTMLPSGEGVRGSGDLWESFPFYHRDGSVETFNGDIVQFFQFSTYPPRRKGEMVVVRDALDSTKTPRRAWQYLVGQRRVRMAPTLAFDTPNSSFAGLQTYDDVMMFNGSLERYDWKLVGKKEIYVPYNCYEFELAPSTDDVLMPGHPNPDYIRWELHRVYEVEATLKDGSRHIYAKRNFFLDEDTSIVVQVDNYDGRGNLWRTNYPISLNAYDLPGYMIRTYFYFDLQTDTYLASSLFNGPEYSMILGDPKPESFFTAEQIRRIGLR